MTKPLRFDDEAVEEMDAAAQWYEARHENLGLEFVAEVRQALIAIANAPQTWPVAAGHESQARRALLRRFPYAIVYIQFDAEI